ncbi:SipW-dependent-type signal peptide-containing protein [Spirilliplanes yamanashiensis]|uniref:SipW-cognate class signal peptide n=1 Tax=Spirilliplanes yamanashiensis TaxID=42233 RepID=A0A8J3Y7B5_9ACTN|nr:SipW-dependent-type signal peptide-containing protein [Spirilliplanes yamanashiensis]MDP9815002.1 putative ribosomally synthesized peptide with SipW-like signal peptide [Spirilliplanes yamanashiensis]GIJ02657.1 hypothetical protein Sya03_20090 [Spirilliplanes yamanashiensis]
MTTDHAPRGYRPRHRPGPADERAKFAVIVSAALVIGLVGGTATWSAWNARTDNTGNEFETGTVVLQDDTSGGTLFALPAMEPGVVEENCVELTYAGSLPSEVRLYGAPTAGTLGPYLNLTVTRGTGGAHDDCSSFVPDATSYAGLGPGVLFQDDLTDYPSTFAAGVPDPLAAWPTNETHSYRFSIDVDDVNAAQGRTLTQTFSWEAQR